MDGSKGVALRNALAGRYGSGALSSVSVRRGPAGMYCIRLAGVAGELAEELEAGLRWQDPPGPEGGCGFRDAVLETLGVPANECGVLWETA